MRNTKFVKTDDTWNKLFVLVTENKYCLPSTGFALYNYFWWLVNIFGDSNINLFGKNVLKCDEQFNLVMKKKFVLGIL